MSTDTNSFTLGGGAIDVTAFLHEIGERGIDVHDIGLYAAYSVEYAQLYPRDEALARAAAVAALEYERGRVGGHWVAEQYSVAREEHLNAWSAVRELETREVLDVEDRAGIAIMGAFKDARARLELASATCVAVARARCAALGGPSLWLAREFGVGPAKLNQWLGRVEEASMPERHPFGGEIPATDPTPTWADWVYTRSNDADDEGVKLGASARVELGEEIAKAVLQAGGSLNDKMTTGLADQIRKHVI